MCEGVRVCVSRVRPTAGGLWLLVLQKSLKVHEGPGVPGLVPSSIVLCCFLVVLEDGGEGGAGGAPLV